MKFNWDNKVFQALGKMVDCIALSAMWLVCCLPIITFGASTSALYYAVHKSVRGNRGYMTKNFFHALTNFFSCLFIKYYIFGFQKTQQSARLLYFLQSKQDVLKKKSSSRLIQKLD